jgi:Protein of unknown function (DUF2911)
VAFCTIAATQRRGRVRRAFFGGWTAVVDENVAIVANDATSGEVVVDDAGACFGKYARHLSRRGQPGIGNAFLRHMLENAHNSKFDVLRAPMSVRTSDIRVEKLTIGFVNATATSATLQVMWETTVATIDLKLATGGTQ